MDGINSSGRRFVASKMYEVENLFITLCLQLTFLLGSTHPVTCVLLVCNLYVHLFLFVSSVMMQQLQLSSQTGGGCGIVPLNSPGGSTLLCSANTCTWHHIICLCK